MKPSPCALAASGPGYRCQAMQRIAQNLLLRSSYFFTGAIASLAALATRNLTTVLALILIASPV
jgi:hypothetical protein